MGGYHEEELFLTLNTPVAVREAARVSSWVEAGLRVWRRPTGILHFSAALTGSGSSYCLPPAPDSISLEMTILRELGEDYEFHREQISIDAEKLHRAHLLASESNQRWAYWFHCGDHGLLYEYCYGWDQSSGTAFFDISNDWTSRHAVSPLTQAVRFVGGVVPQEMEDEWFGGQLHRLLWDEPHR
jgi:hypothetical protein